MRQTTKVADLLGSDSEKSKKCLEGKRRDSDGAFYDRGGVECEGVSIGITSSSQTGGAGAKGCSPTPTEQKQRKRFLNLF